MYIQFQNEQDSTLLRQIRIVLIFISVTFLASGCSLYPEPYKIDIAQGNKFDEAQVKQIKVGMTERQVMYLLGSPMIQDVFHEGRWDYVHSFKPGKGEVQKKHLRLLFKRGILQEIETPIPANNASS
ncbi:MAG: outer membrane protein assembly factor BamE [Pseudomonadales bacterium]|nr:outer membrane protein assembly factor BamE [Pseudomonadales bacterium]